MKQAFFEVCREPTPARTVYVSLYVELPFYGGPEEGGWWGRDMELVAYERFDSEEAATAALRAIHVLADKLSKEAKDSFNRACAAESEWLEARGLDDGFLPEVNGEASYRVYIEGQPGEFAYEGSRGYS
jgi:hypothetical protein